MNLVVLLRGWRRDPDTHLETEVLGRHERWALTLACRLRNQFPGSSVTALTAGDEAEDRTLRVAVALGADRARRLWDPILPDLDALGVARALGAAVGHLGFDVVLAGSQSPDDGLGFLGPAVAEALDISHLTDVVDLSWNEAQDGLKAERHCAGRRYTHDLSAPHLVTVFALDEPDALPEPDPGIQPDLLTLADVSIDAEVLRPRIHLAGEPRADVESPYETAWVEDAEAVIEHLRDLDLLP